jgi:hypothetical protein
MDLTLVAYATLALSLFVSAVKVGGFILNADPRAIINSGRWALVALVALTPGGSIWRLARRISAVRLMPSQNRAQRSIRNWCSRQWPCCAPIWSKRDRGSSKSLPA